MVRVQSSVFVFSLCVGMSWLQVPHLQLMLPVWVAAAAATAKSLQSCPTLCSPIDGSPPGSPVLGILQDTGGTLEWVAISFSNAWKWKVKVKSLSHVWLLATPWTTAYQAPLSWDFPGKSTGVGCHCLLHKPLYFVIVISKTLHFIIETESYCFPGIIFKKTCHITFSNFI